jgi:hypothetical protein
VGLLARDAEFSGWQFQRNALRSGVVALDPLVANFLTSQEYLLRFGSPSNAEFVRLLYRHVLLREGAPAEVALQQQALATVSRAQLATAFLNSAEFRAGTGSRLTAFLLYSTILLRDPAVWEREAAAARLVAAIPLSQLVAELLAGPEFTNLLR